ncbi:hypothetical protein BDW60DRAFT_179164 [Aspergillus nidulans var. acristatus]
MCLGTLDRIDYPPTMLASAVPPFVPLIDSYGHTMAGWWNCCRCRNMNNPDLCGGRCTVCGHIKDQTCSPV